MKTLLWLTTIWIVAGLEHVHGAKPPNIPLKTPAGVQHSSIPTKVAVAVKPQTPTVLIEDHGIVDGSSGSSKTAGTNDAKKVPAKTDPTKPQTQPTGGQNQKEKTVFLNASKFARTSTDPKGDIAKALKENLYVGMATHAEYCKVSATHPGCKFTKLDEAKCDVKTMVQRGLSEQDMQDLIDNHNAVRRLFAYGQPFKGYPPGSNIAKVEWDNELAATAQLLADQCDLKHSYGPLVKTKDASQVGQNMWRGGIGTMANNGSYSIVKGWFKEAENSNADYTLRKPGAPEPTGEYGHFEEVIWATVNRIGCGYVATKNSAILACNYVGVPNPKMGEKPKVPYHEGKACSRCKEYYGPTAGCEDGLCLTPMGKEV